MCVLGSIGWIYIGIFDFVEGLEGTLEYFGEFVDLTQIVLDEPPSPMV